MLKMKHNIVEIQKMLKDVQQSAVREATSRSIRQAANATKAYGAKKVSKAHVATISAKDVKARVKVSRISPKQPWWNMEATVRFSGSELNIRFFNPRAFDVSTSRGMREAVITTIAGRSAISGGFHLLLQHAGSKLVSGAHKAFGSDSLLFKRIGNTPKIIARPSVASIIRTKHLEAELRAYAHRYMLNRFAGNFKYFKNRIASKYFKRTMSRYEFSD